MAIPTPPSQAVKHKRLEAMRLAVKLLAGCKSTDMVFVLAEAIKDYLESGQRPSKKLPPPVPDGPPPVRIREGKKPPHPLATPDKSITPLEPGRVGESFEGD